MFGELHILPIALAPADAAPLAVAKVELIAERASAFVIAPETVVRISGCNPRVLVGGTSECGYGWTVEVPSRFAASHLGFSIVWTLCGARGQIRRETRFALTLAAGRGTAWRRRWSMEDADVPAHPEAAPYRGAVVDLGAAADEASAVRSLTLPPHGDRREPIGAAGRPARAQASPRAASPSPSLSSTPRAAAARARGGDIGS